MKWILKPDLDGPISLEFSVVPYSSNFRFLAARQKTTLLLAEL